MDDTSPPQGSGDVRGSPPWLYPTWLLGFFNLVTGNVAMTTPPTLRWNSIVLENAQKRVELGGGGQGGGAKVVLKQPDQSQAELHP